MIFYWNVLNVIIVWQICARNVFSWLMIMNIALNVSTLHFNKNHFFLFFYFFLFFFIFIFVLPRGLWRKIQENWWLMTSLLMSQHRSNFQNTSETKKRGVHWKKWSHYFLKKKWKKIDPLIFFFSRATWPLAEIK